MVNRLVVDQCSLIDEEEDQCRDEGTYELSNPVGNNLAPGKLATNSECERHGGIDMSTTCCTRNINTQRDSQTPTPCNDHPVQLDEIPEEYQGCYTAIAEQQQD